jgi:hypothetical protein
MTKEETRLAESGTRNKHWKRWGPYLSERAWGTVREDYSPHGNAWEYLPHDHARSRAYRWNEDGLAGISDGRQVICFALALWNERDSILKERIFGLTNNEGNHGEDVKEYYFYLDSTPSHSYMKYLYKYPQTEFPYAKLVEENRSRDRRQPEFELLDTGVFDEDRYFDVFVEYAKADIEDILIKITVTNRGPEAANLRVLPTIWFRNTWSWGNRARRPRLRKARPVPNHCHRAEWDVAGELSRRMTNIFLRDHNGHRPVFGNLQKFQSDPHWRDLVLFHEYFHGDSGSGVGASHQTGWTGVVTKLMQQSGETGERKKTEPAVATASAD